MSYRITDEYVCGGAISDKTEALAGALQTLTDAGLDLEMIMSRRDQSGWSLVFVSPLRTMQEIEAAEKVGLRREGSLRTLRIEGPNVRGVGARIMSLLAQAHVPVRGYWALSLGDQCVTDIAFDSEEDEAKAKTLLEKELAS